MCILFYLCIYCLSTCPDACNHDISVGVYVMLLVVLMLIIKEGRKEGNILLMDAYNIIYLVIWHHTYGKGPLT